MNAKSAEIQTRTAAPTAVGWSWGKILLFILLAFAAHFAFAYLLGAKKTVPVRAVSHVPVFHLAENASELVRLTDPTMFALPHLDDFIPAAWARTPTARQPWFHWLEPSAFLALNAGELGMTFAAFMQTNQFSSLPLDFKPEPQLEFPNLDMEPVRPTNSTWQLAGEIVGRQSLNSLSPPPLAVNDVLEPSRVQLLVDADGNVASTVLLDGSGNNDADQLALKLARTLRFAPAEKLMFGEIIFAWRTVPAATTNAP